jgi:hypothetical protein
MILALFPSRRRGLLRRTITFCTLNEMKWKMTIHRRFTESFPLLDPLSSTDLYPDQTKISAE